MVFDINFEDYIVFTMSLLHPRKVVHDTLVKTMVFVTTVQNYMVFTMIIAPSETGKTR